MIAQMQQPFGNLAFGVIQMIGINQRRTPGILHRQRSLTQQLGQDLGHAVTVTGEFLHGGLHQNLFRHAGMSGIRCPQQRIANSGRNPFEIFGVRATGERNPIGRAKTDSVDLLSQPVRVLFNHLHGVIAIYRVDSAGIRPRNSPRFEKKHQFAQLRLGRIRFDDHRQFLGPDPLDFEQMTRFPLQNIHRFQTKPGHHPLSHGRPDALDGAGREKTLNCRQGRRLNPSHHLAAKLLAIFLVHSPGSRHLDIFARHRRANAAGDDHQPLVGFQTKHDIFILTLKSYIFDHACQCVHFSSHFQPAWPRKTY